jgi:DNA-binding response OmpR family regulator
VISQKRLLFVDDEPNIRATLPVILRRYGFTVTVAATVAQALDAIKKQDFDILLSDLNIERETDGLDVVRAMRAKNPQCVAMILTAYPGVETAVEGIHLGIDDYLLKPTNADTLVALLAEKLARRQSKGRVLTIAYDEPLFQTSNRLLQSAGYDVVSSIHLDGTGDVTKLDFDALVLGKSVPSAEKRAIIESFRKRSKAPVISVTPAGAESDSAQADYLVEPDPEILLKKISEAIHKKSAAKNMAS